METHKNLREFAICGGMEDGGKKGRSNEVLRPFWVSLFVGHYVCPASDDVKRLT